MTPVSAVRKFLFPALISVFASCSSRSDVMTGGQAGIADTVPVLQVVEKTDLPAALSESSGLCYTDGQLWTFGDSGNPNQLFRIDSSNGKVLQTVTVSNFSNVDWEDIAADDDYVYIGDFGNNNGTRKDLKVIRIKKSDMAGNEAMTMVTGEAINFSYADQTSFNSTDSSNYDCESMIALNDKLYLFSKDAGDLKTRCYQVSKLPGKYSLTPVSGFDVQGRITAAAYNGKSNELALLGYLDKKGDGESFVWFFDNFPGDHFFAGKPMRFVVGDEKFVQTEGLDYISAKTLFMSCETDAFENAALYVLKKPQ